MRASERVERGLNALAKRLGRRPYFARLYASLDEQLRVRIAARAEEGSPRLAVSVTLLAVVALLVFFHFQVAKILEFPPAAYADPRVFNLTKEGVLWDTFYGAGESCGTVDCFVSRS